MSGRLMDEMHRVMRRRHYSIRTERSYSMWVKRYVAFHKMKSRDDFRVRWMILIHILDHLLISWS
jgi:integrase-like protein